MRVVRPFGTSDEDHRALCAAKALVFPDYPLSVEEIRHDDSTWDHSRHFRARWLALADGEVVGWIVAQHARSRFVADTYHLDGGVVPAARGRGHGSALYDTMLATLRDRGARRLRASAQDSAPQGIAFLAHRGFSETRREWESRLTPRDFDAPAFDEAPRRVAAAGIRITTLATEMASDPAAARRSYELWDELANDVPSIDPHTAVGFETWAQGHLHGPNVLLDGFFIALDAAGHWLGLSNVEASPDDKTFLWQGLTGVRRDARGRGIAMALKLETIRYARDRGYDHIKTWNDQSNRPMLRINEALGFVKQPAWVEFEKEL